jgi:hypothetical protein
MKSIVSGFFGLVVVGVLAGCAGQTEQLSMQSPTGQPPQSVTFPMGRLGGASGRQASELAQIVVDSNNNNMRDYQQPRARARICKLATSPAMSAALQ